MNLFGESLEGNSIVCGVGLEVEAGGREAEASYEQENGDETEGSFREKMMWQTKKRMRAQLSPLE